MNTPVTMLELPPVHHSVGTSKDDKQTNQYQWPQFYMVASCHSQSFAYQNSAGSPRIIRTALEKITNLAYQHLGSLQAIPESSFSDRVAAWIPKALRSPESCKWLLNSYYHRYFHLAGRSTRPKDVWVAFRLIDSNEALVKKSILVCSQLLDFLRVSFLCLYSRPVLRKEKKRTSEEGREGGKESFYLGCLFPKTYVSFKQ